MYCGNKTEANKLERIIPRENWLKRLKSNSTDS